MLRVTLGSFKPVISSYELFLEYVLYSGARSLSNTALLFSSSSRSWAMMLASVGSGKLATALGVGTSTGTGAGVGGAVENVKPPGSITSDLTAFLSKP
jgi:hypothetical protein